MLKRPLKTVLYFLLADITVSFSSMLKLTEKFLKNFVNNFGLVRKKVLFDLRGWAAREHIQIPRQGTFIIELIA